MPRKRRFQVTGLILTAAPGPVAADTTSQPISERTASVQREGPNLSQAILQAYNERTNFVRESRRASGLDITPAVSRFIEPGTSFDRAEQILRVAGLNVSARPGPEGWNSNRRDRFAVCAYSYEYFNRSRIYRFFRPIYKDFSTKLFIDLFPAKPEDYDKVAKITAVVTFISL